MHARHADFQNRCDLGQIELFDEVELYHQLQPVWQCSDRIRQAGAILDLQQTRFGIRSSLRRICNAPRV